MRLKPFGAFGDITFDNWIQFGIEQGWCGPPVCSTHDGTPTTEAEDNEFDDGADPCLHVVRLYEDTTVKAAVEANHPPTLWRRT